MSRSSGATAFTAALSLLPFSQSPQKHTGHLTVCDFTRTRAGPVRWSSVSLHTPVTSQHTQQVMREGARTDRQTESNFVTFQHCSFGTQHYYHGLIRQTIQNRLNSTQQIHINSTTQQYPLLHLAKYLFIINLFKSSWSQSILFTFLGCNNAFGRSK